MLVQISHVKIARKMQDSITQLGAKSQTNVKG